MRAVPFHYILLVFIKDVLPARILGLFPHIGKSHQMAYDPLLRRLAERGHDVTAVTFFPLKNPPEHYRAVSLEGLTEIRVESINMSIYEGHNVFLRLTGLDRIRSHISENHPLADFALDTCSKLVSFKPLSELLKKEYDVILTENFNSDCMLGLANVYGQKAPIVYLSSCTAMYWALDRFGVTDNPSYVPLVSSIFTTPMTFLQRLENAVLNVYFKVWFRYAIQLREQKIIEEHFGRKILDLQEMAKNVSLMLVNAHHSLNGVRPLIPGIVEVGGMHLDKTRRPISQVSE